jgi:hypothetical protein
MVGKKKEKKKNYKSNFFYFFFEKVCWDKENEKKAKQL